MKSIYISIGVGTGGEAGGGGHPQIIFREPE